MRDPRLVHLRLAADRDRRLSNAGSRLFSLLVGFRYASPDPVDEPFPAPWTIPGKWLGWSFKTAYRALNELVSLGYLAKAGTRGSPPKAHYRFILTAESPSNYPKNGIIKTPKNGINDYAKNGANLTSNPFGKEMTGRKEFEPAKGRKATRGKESSAAEPRVTQEEWAAIAARELAVTPEEMAEFEAERKAWEASRAGKGKSQ